MLNEQTSRSIGDIGEDYVCRHLSENGYEILCRNYTIKGGEIDIIARKENVVAFVEVKTRKTNAFTSGESALSYTKKKRLLMTANNYLHKNKIKAFCRFDLAVIHHINGRVVYFKYYRAAFDASSK